MLPRLVLSLLAICTFLSTGCFSPKTNVITSNINSEKAWINAFDVFVKSFPPCPNGKHTLVEGQKYFPKFSGSCFECRSPLGITESKINRFTQKRTTTVAKVYTCTEACKYNVCESCVTN